MTPSPRDAGTPPDDGNGSCQGTAADHPGATSSDELSELSYEQARDELIAAVQQLENGGVPLAESLALWERSEKLAAICQQRLEGAKQRVQAAREHDAENESGTDD
jgi:exodeoxyribonuclease VII small subunit